MIDDDPQIRRTMRITLTAHGYQVADAKSGEEGLAELRNSAYDLVLLDVNMPGMGGLETCRMIRSTSEVAIIMLTVSSSEKDKINAFAQAVFSSVYQQTNFLESGKFYVEWYGASAVAGYTAVDITLTQPILGESESVFGGDALQVPSGRLFGTRFAGNTPWFNSSDAIRLGWRYIAEDGVYNFSLRGDAIDYIYEQWFGGEGPLHIDLFPSGWWF